MSLNDIELVRYGKDLVNEHLSLSLGIPPARSETVFFPPPPPPELCLLPQLKVGILGAGACGLYTALILDSLGIEYDILEASDRIGGRIQTIKFPGGDDYDYFDAGATRFPLPQKDKDGQYKNGFMKRVGKLIEYGPLNTGDDKLKDMLIPFLYTMQGPRSAFLLIEGDAIDLPPTDDGVLRSAETESTTTVDPNDPYAVMNALVELFLKKIRDKKFTQFDSYSVRTYLASSAGSIDGLKSLSPVEIGTLIEKYELVVTGTRGFDMSITEWVIGSIAFGQVHKPDPVEWKCFRGGTETMTKRMAGYITAKRGDAIQTRKKVTAISEDTMVVCLRRGRIPLGWDETDLLADVQIHEDDTVRYFVPPSDNWPSHSQPPEDPRRPINWMRVKVPCVAVTLNGTETRKYSHVISTLTLPVLRAIDLTKAGLSKTQMDAIRALTYWPAIKIGVLFKTNWWTRILGIVGGQSFSDLPIRTILYPSYGDHTTTSNASSACKVLVCFAMVNDTRPLAPLAPKEKHEELRELVLRTLADVHSRFAAKHNIQGSINSDLNTTLRYLQDQFVAMEVKDWSADEYTRGAFAHWYPGNHENFDPALHVPAAKRRLHFAGEAISTSHGWVLGSFQSAWSAVNNYLQLTGQEKKLRKFKEIWGANVAWTK